MKKCVNLKWLVAVLIFTVSTAPSFSQITNKGKDFWVGYGHHQFMETNKAMDMVLYLSAEDTATVTVTIFGSGGGIGPSSSPEWKRVYKMQGNTVISTGTTDATDWAPKTGPNAIPSKGPMPKGQSVSGWDAFYNCALFDTWGAEPPAAVPTPFRKKAIHITSTADIVAYAHIYGSASSGATMLLPTKAWGYNYTAINNKQAYASNCYSWMYVIAEHDDTYVEITPSQTTKGGRVAGIPFYITLNKGEIYQIAGVTTGSTGVELTGTRVRSLAKPGTNNCYPVAVFCGSSRTSNPSNCGSGGGDNDNQQMFPQEAWGKRYLLAPLSTTVAGMNGLMINMYKIVTNDPTTVVRRRAGGGALTTMTPTASNSTGNIYYFESGTADYIESDKPIMVAQFMSGGSSCLGGGVGDPEMIYLSPIEQAINRIGFYRNTYENIVANFVTMIVPTSGISSLKIDGTLFAAIPAAEKYSAAIASLPGYSMVAKKWVVTPKGPGAQCIVTCDSFFNAVTYGLGSVESYGYNAGTNLNNLNIKPSLRNVLDTSQTKEHPFTCTNTDFDLSIYSAYKPYKIDWVLSQVPAISPNADVSIGNLTGPLVPLDTTYFDGVPYYRYKAPGGPYHFNTLGSHIIPVRFYNPLIENCYNREDLSITLEVKKKPVADFNFTLSGCPADSVRFQGLNNDPDYTIGQWKWNFPGGGTSQNQNAASLIPVGNNNIKLTVVSEEGCIGDTTKVVNVPAGATADFTVDFASVCEGQEITFTPSPGLSSSSFYWDFGDGKKDTMTTNAPIKHRYNVYDTVIASLTLSASGNCNPISTKEIIIKANPILGVTYPAGCLPSNGIVQFNSTTKVPDGQTVNTHAWNFGDPNANPGNPNTSAAPNPTHTYQYGTYAITYSATTSGGCTKDTIINATFNIKPDLGFSSLPDVCENDITISVARGTVNNGVPGIGRYRGPGTDSTGILNPKIAGPGTHTIWFIYAATSGCTDSISQTVKINAAPQPNFIHPTGCLPANGIAQFEDRTNISDGQTLNWEWTFGDPNATAGNPNKAFVKNPTHEYTQYGVYNVNLLVTSQFGCVKDTTKQVTLAIRPVLVFPPLANACENNGISSVAKATVTNGITGNGKYFGSGTDTLGNFNPLTAGLGQHTITYIFEATGGCIDSAIQTISVFANPKLNFTFPQGCLPSNNILQFTNNSTIADTQTVGWLWNFGDPLANGGNPNFSLSKNPTHRYNAEGAFSVKLSAATQQGCTADTTIIANLGVRPVLTFSAIPDVCESVVGIVPVAYASVTNGLQGTGIYSGPGTISNGQFEPQVAGPGKHTIKFVFTTAGGCVDSITQTVNVFAKPIVNFSFPQGCLPVNNILQFTNNSTIADTQNVAWLWNFGDPLANAGNPNTSVAKNPTHRYDAEGNFSVKLSAVSSQGCTGDTTIVANLAVRPVLAFSAIPAVCESVGTVSVANASVTNGLSGTGVYSGAGTSSAGQFDPLAAGPGRHIIKYVFTTSGGCADSITQTVNVFAKPKVSFTFPQGCLPANNIIQFTNNSTIADTQTVAWLWNFGDPLANAGNPNTSVAKNPTHRYDAEGNFNVKLSAVSSQGCTGDTTIVANLAVRPVLAFSAIPAVCESAGTVSVANASVTNGLSGTGVYSGAGTTSAGQFNPLAAGPGQHIIKYVFTTSGGCADSITQTVNVFAKPKVSFTFPQGCLPANNILQFTNNSTIADTQTVAWLWNFGDPLANAGNPNISLAKNPTHRYDSEGAFNVKLTATSSRGCMSDTTIVANLGVRPKLVFNPVTSVCKNTPVISVANASVTNGITGTGVYKGPGTAIDGKFDPAIAGVGTHTIWYVFNTTGGCSDSISQTVTVKALPVADFISTADICLDGTTTLTDQSSLTGGTISSWTWSFGDGTSATRNNGAPFTKSYALAGSYTIKLVVAGSNGCSSDTGSKVTVVHPLPVVSFTKPTSICMPGGQAQFTNSSTIPGNGTLTYVWNFGDGNTSTLANPSHVYGAINSYSVNLEATSSFGCKANTTQVLSEFFDKPVAAFTANPDKLCQGLPSLFTDNSTAPNSSIASRFWSFGDGTTSTASTVTKTYANAGTYNVKLVVTNTVGCISDTAFAPVIVYLQPVIDAGKSFTAKENTVIRFEATANSGNLTFSWTPGFEMDNPTLLNPSLTVTRDATYTLTATGANGCKASDTTHVMVQRGVVIPNAFSPNGDGINDTWILKNLDNYPQAELQVFDRYGKLTYRGFNGSRPWDGTRNGKPVPSGVYYYVIKLNDSDTPAQSGSVTLIR